MTAAPSSTPASASAQALARTPLHDLHLELGAKMVPFAGYAMPVQYPAGILKEHQHTRTQASLFDVSHMGQLHLRGAQVAELLESLIPADYAGLAPMRQRYGFFTNAQGGMLDDLMVCRRHDDWFMVVNAGCKQADLLHLQTRLQASGLDAHITAHFDAALLALQGPKAVTALARLAPDCAKLVFMQGAYLDIMGVRCFATRSGYSGEDGFEISVPAAHAVAVTRQLLAQPEVQPAGLGARDTLRLEAGLCLYGHDLDPTTTPVEAGLNWAMQKVRRSGGARAGGFPGADVILAQLEGRMPLTRQRVGLQGLERMPVREGASLQNEAGERVGSVTSGAPSPTLGQPIAMAYVHPDVAAAGTRLDAVVRDKTTPMQVCAMPFVPQRYVR